MDDTDGLFYTDLPAHVWVVCGIEIIGCLVAVVASLTVLRRGLAALLTALGAALAGGATAATLVAYGHSESNLLTERFWELTTYTRAVGLALLGLGLVLALLRSRRPTPSGPSQHQ